MFTQMDKKYIYGVDPQEVIAATLIGEAGGETESNSLKAKFCLEGNQYSMLMQKNLKLQSELVLKLNLLQNFLPMPDLKL